MYSITVTHRRTYAAGREAGMKIHKRIIAGLAITVYNDSNIYWVIESAEHSPMRFNRNHWTMAEAIDFYIRTWA